MKFDASAAWSDAMRLLSGQREILLTLTGFFILLPLLMLTTLRPFTGVASNVDEFVAQYEQWANANLIYILLVLALAAFGRVAMLILLLAPERPTVAEALKAGMLFAPIVILADLLAFVPFVFGMTLFIIPGLYVAGRLFLIETALVGERLRNPLAPLGVSWRITRGNGWRIALMLTVIFIGAYLVQTALGLAIGVVLTLLAGREAGDFALLLVSATANAGLQLVLMLVAVAGWRQLSIR